MLFFIYFECRLIFLKKKRKKPSREKEVFWPLQNNIEVMGKYQLNKEKWL
jgi:hypothetical protein